MQIIVTTIQWDSWFSQAFKVNYMCNILKIRLAYVYILLGVACLRLTCALFLFRATALVILSAEDGQKVMKSSQNLLVKQMPG